MTKALLIAEKPSLMRDIQKVYKKLQLPFEIEMEKVGFKCFANDTRTI